MVAKKVRSIWDEASDAARLWAKRLGALGAVLVTLSGVIAMGPEAYAPQQELAEALEQDRAIARQDRAELAKQAARIDSVMVFMAERAAVDREQTRILLYLQCGMAVARGERPPETDCDDDFITGTIQRGL